MRLLKIIFLFLTLIACNQEKQDTLAYVVSLAEENNIPMLKVDMTFPAASNGETILSFKNNTWGEKDLHNTLHNAHILFDEGHTSDDFKITKQRDSGWVTITHPKDIKTVTISYLIKQDSNEGFEATKTYRPVIQSTYFHVFSHGLFMLPLTYDSDPEQPFNVSIQWKDFPAAYKIQNSFGSNKRAQEIDRTSASQFMNAIFLGGDYRLYDLSVKGNRVVYATRDDWVNFKDSTIVNVLQKTIAAQRDFWDDHTQPYYAISLTPTIVEGQTSSFQGTCLTNSFNCSASNNKYLDLEGLVYLFNHELQHNWIGTLIKNTNEEAQYWFSEGFTDYFTIKNIARNNIYNLDKTYYISKLNEIIKLLHLSPVKEVPNSAINYDTFWSDREYEKLPYRRGALFAFYLDLKIHHDSQGKQSLDDLMKAIKVDAELTGQKIDHAYFIKKANQFLNEDVTPFFNTHIEEGRLLDLEALSKIANIEIHYPVTEVFQIGYAISDEYKIIAIDTSSNAYKAGLRKGDELNRWSYSSSHPIQEATIEIIKDSKKTMFTFLPVKTLKLPQLLNNDHTKAQLPFKN